MAAPPDCAYYFTVNLNGGWLNHSSSVHGQRPKSLRMRYFAATLMALFLALADPAAAQRFPPPGGGVSLNQIVNSIRSRFPGQLSDVQNLGGQYRIKWLTPDGNVIWITADARTGQILGQEGGGGGGRNFGGRPFGPPQQQYEPPPQYEDGPDREPNPGRGRGRGRIRDR